MGQAGPGILFPPPPPPPPPHPPAQLPNCRLLGISKKNIEHLQKKKAPYTRVAAAAIAIVKSPPSPRSKPTTHAPPDPIHPHSVATYLLPHPGTPNQLSSLSLSLSLPQQQQQQPQKDWCVSVCAQRAMPSAAATPIISHAHAHTRFLADEEKEGGRRTDG